MYNIGKAAILFMIGGLTYVGVEMMWRGHSHSSMFVLGGLCFLCIGALNNHLPWELGFVWQCLMGAGIITGLEFATGLIVNIWMGLGVWDYSNMPLNVMGQICLPFSLAWIALAAVAIVLDDYLRYWLFNEEKPHYKLL